MFLKTEKKTSAMARIFRDIDRLKYNAIFAKYLGASGVKSVPAAVFFR